MKRVYLRTAFILLVIVVGVIFMAPAKLALDALFPVSPGRDALPLGVLAVALCLWIADRSVSWFFRLARLTDERWSVFRSRGRS
jgi:hypothetical protein